MKPQLFRTFLDRYIPRYNTALEKIAFAYSGDKTKIPIMAEQAIHGVRSHVEPMFQQIDAMVGDVDVPDAYMGAAVHDVSLALRALEEVRLARLN